MCKSRISRNPVKVFHKADEGRHSSCRSRSRPLTVLLFRIVYRMKRWRNDGIPENSASTCLSLSQHNTRRYTIDLFNPRNKSHRRHKGYVITNGSLSANHMSEKRPENLNLLAYDLSLWVHKQTRGILWKCLREIVPISCYNINDWRRQLSIGWTTTITVLAVGQTQEFSNQTVEVKFITEKNLRIKI